MLIEISFIFLLPLGVQSIKLPLYEKTILFVFIASFIFAFVACEQDGDMHKKDAKKSLNIEKEKAKVSELLDLLAAATESGDMQAVEKIWCPKEEAMLIGTESTEKLVGWNQIKKAIDIQNSSFSETLISITDQNIWMDEDARTAWFFEELNYNFIYKDKARSFEGIRFTGVFKKSTENEWRLVQGHMSVPAHMDME